MYVASLPVKDIFDMDQHYGYIDANRGYTLQELATILLGTKGADGKPIKTSTVRNNLTQIGCPIPTLGRIAIVPGRLILLALERQAAEFMDDEYDIFNEEVDE